jgi:hypothetical protein
MARPKKPATTTSPTPVAPPPAPKPMRTAPSTAPVGPTTDGKRSSATRPDGKVATGEEQVRLHAYLKWEAAGKPPGDGALFWLEAERELLPSKLELQKRTSL